MWECVCVCPLDSLTESSWPERILLYPIAMVDYDQDNNEVCKDLLKTKDGIDCLAHYNSSVGRYFFLF
uniref:Uncharacterized protein n=1 Tax=Cajanus cajan TaxID=3821 RepID=A0A151QSC6_CAJCA|nr:hypothetical protein KK1_045956 [Cajanus cajan]